MGNKINYKNFIKHIVLSEVVHEGSKDCQLLYDDEGKYYLFITEKDKTTTTPININENPADFQYAIQEKKTDKYNKQFYPVAKLQNNTSMDLIKSLACLYDLSIGNNFQKVNKQFNKVTNETIIKKVNKIAETQINHIDSIQILTDDYLQLHGYSDKKDGIYKYKKYESKNDAGQVISTDIVPTDFVGSILIKKYGKTEDKITYDQLNKFPAVNTIKYIDTKMGTEKEIIRKPKETIVRQLINDEVLKLNENEINKFLTNLYNDCDNENIVFAETDLLRDGFFYDNHTDKVIANNVFNDLNTTDDDVVKAIILVNELLKERKNAIPNDCDVIRFFLWSPFGFCLKQIGITNSLYSVVSWGTTDTSKTGVGIIYSNFYTHWKNTYEKGNTQSAIGSRLEENTYPLILDEAADNLRNPKDEEFNKNIVYDIIGRSVKDRNNNKNIDDFPALRMTYRTLNPDLTQEFKGEFYKRHKVLHYDQTMQMSDTKIERLNKKFEPQTIDSPLKQLRHLGKAFAERMIPYIENKSKELYDVEGLTIKILRQIEKDYNAEFNINLMIRQDLVDEKDTASLIRHGLNKLFRKNHRMQSHLTSYIESDFINCAMNGEIKWLDYQTRNDIFVIKIKDFKIDVDNILGENIPLEEVFKELDIPFEKKDIKFKGKSIKGMKIDIVHLSYNLFDIDLYAGNEYERNKKLGLLETPEQTIKRLKIKKQEIKEELDIIDTGLAEVETPEQRLKRIKEEETEIKKELEDMQREIKKMENNQ